jgi:polyhydroxybutyrate depolymerase
LPASGLGLLLNRMEPIILNIRGVPRRFLFQQAQPGSPVVVFLHGTGGTADWCESETGLGAACQQQGYAYAVPDGLPVNPSKEAKFLTNPARWNDGSTRPGDTLHTEVDDVAFLDSIIENLQERGCSSIFLTGFSNGAGMAFRYAAERAEVIAALAPVAGYCWTDAKPCRPVPTLYMVGDSDPLIPWAGGPVRLPWGGRVVERPSVPETLAKWASANGEEPRVEVIPGLGHHWPGGRGQLSARIGGPPESQVSANERILRFFASLK